MWEDTEVEDAKFCLALLKNEALLAEEDLLDQVAASAGLENGIGLPENSMADNAWETIDPTPDIHALFLELNRAYFANTLEPCTVSWSTRMTSCAGLCRFEGAGGLCSISLSERLLKFRPRKNLLETLLHEMIHAYLFLTSADRDRDGHGPHFVEHMNRINAKSGLNITIYHDFHDEVEFYKKHIWQCNGPCANHSPRFGVIRRATNRDPNKDSDKNPWASQHKQFCGGTYIKLSSPNNCLPSKKMLNNPIKSDFDPTPVGIQRYFKPIDVGGRGVPLSDCGPSQSVAVPPAVNPEAHNFTKETWTNNTNGVLNNIGSTKYEPASKRKKMAWSSEDINEWLMAGHVGPVPTNGYLDDLDVRKIQPDPNDLACKATHDLIVQLGYKLDAEGNIVDRLQNANPPPPQIHTVRNTTPPPGGSHQVTFADKVFGSKHVTCPICDQMVVETLINIHLDECMSSYGQTNKAICITEDFPRANATPETDEVAMCPICETYISKNSLEHHAIKCATDRFG